MRRFASLLTGLALLVPSAAVAETPAVGRLATINGSDAAIVDDAGREVLLRGVNVNQLGDYYATQPALPTTLPLKESDFADIAALGFDHVRLIVSWSELEPARGDFSAAYVARIREAVGWARAHGLWVVLDMHQDAWGKFIATPPGETCAPGASPAVGFDGAPQWATLSDGTPTCRYEIREVAPAVAQSWTSFWADRDGIQAELATTWGKLAREFAADPAVAGYDLLNEPNPGYLVGANGASALGEYYARAVAAIRAGEKAAPGGFAHLVFFEPGVEWSATGYTATPPPGFVNDPLLVFAPHLYAGSITVDRAVGVSALSIAQGFELAAQTAASYGVPWWSGEWGWFGDPATDGASVREYAAQEDAHRVGGAWWDWKQSCGDPHQFGAPGGQPGAVSPSLNRFKCPANEPLGRPAVFESILSRAYPRAVPGRLKSLVSELGGVSMSLVGSDPVAAGSCRLEVWLPRVPDGRERRIATTGVAAVRVERLGPSGSLLTGCASGDYKLDMTTVAVAAPLASGPRGDRCRSRRVRIAVPRLRSGARRVTVQIDRRPARSASRRARHVVVRVNARAHTIRVRVVGRYGKRLLVTRRVVRCAGR